MVVMCDYINERYKTAFDALCCHIFILHITFSNTAHVNTDQQAQLAILPAYIYIYNTYFLVKDSQSVAAVFHFLLYSSTVNVCELAYNSLMSHCEL